MEKTTLQSANVQPNRRMQPPLKSSQEEEMSLSQHSPQRRENHGPTEISGRAVDTPDGTIEEVPEEQAP